MSDFYDDICEVRIQTEGHKGGYLVRIVDEDNTTTYHLAKDDLLDLLKKLHETAVAKGSVETHRMSDSTTPQDGKAMSPASAGSQPVAWAVVYFDEIDSVYDTKEDCERFMETQCRRDYMTAVPLYRNPDGEQEYSSLRAENERLRAAIRLLADQDATLSVQGGNVTVTMDGTLTDEEREALKWAIAHADDLEQYRLKAALSLMMERLG